MSFPTGKDVSERTAALHFSGTPVDRDYGLYSTLELDRRSGGFY
jgi:hypothetical protein